MVRTYEFTPHSFELPIERKKRLRCKVWESDHTSPSVAVIEYDFGKDLNDGGLQELAEHIVKTHHMSVVAIEYAETKIKYSPDLLSRLESYLPNHLKAISPYLSKRHQELIEQGAFQEVINDLQYKPYTRTPINQDTIISLYGDENSYTDFGVAASLDIIYSLEELRKNYPSWQWNDCIGIGIGYGAYILQLAEKLSPNTFSLLISKGSLIKPIASNIFTNGTELKNGAKEFIYAKSIGKFPLYLNEVQGWTTAQDHPYFFEQRHYDIRNLEYELHLQRSNKQTPLIFVEELSPQGLEEKVNFVEKLIQYNYPVELFVADEDEIDHKTVIKENGTIKVKLEGIFDHYMGKEYSRNLSDSKKEAITILPVYNGVYVLDKVPSLPKFFFIPSNKQLTTKNDMEYLSTFFVESLKELTPESVKELLSFIKNPILYQDENYIEMIS